jgi:predicted membrane protein
MINLCPPALIYIAFSLTQIVIDTFKGLYNTALFKFIVMIIVTFLLNALCQTGMTIVSWIIVFIPFIFMSVIVAILLYVFGLDAATGKLNFKCDECEEQNTGNLIYSSTTYKRPKTNTTVKHVYVDTSYSDTPSEETTSYNNVPTGSSDPQYESFENNE